MGSMPESPTLALKDPTFLPPWKISLAPNVTGDSVFYAGLYTLNLNISWSGMPQYTKESEGIPTLLYVNNSNVWVLGDFIHTDYIFNISISLGVSPVNWTEWRNEGTLETPILFINDPSSLPPYKVTLKSPIYSDSFYDAIYTLDIYTFYNSHPQYSRSDGTLLYIARFPDFSVWLINNGTRPVDGTMGTDRGHSLSWMPDSSFSPYFWAEWKNTGTIESPILHLSNPDLLAPSIQLLPSQNVSRQVFFQGTYCLQYQSYGGYPMYNRTEPKAALYVSHQAWILDLLDNPDSYLKLANRSQLFPTPAAWTEWDFKGSDEGPPDLTVTNTSANYFPSSMVVCYFDLPGDRFYRGKYTLNITHEHNNFPQYYNKEKRLVYVNDFGIWMHGDSTYNIETSKALSFTQAFTTISEQSITYPDVLAVKVLADSPMAWEEWSNPSDFALIPSFRLTDLNILYEFIKRRENRPGHICLKKDGNSLDINLNPASYCNDQKECRSGVDEWFNPSDFCEPKNSSCPGEDEWLNQCPFYVNPSFYYPLLMAAGGALAGFVVFAALPFITPNKQMGVKETNAEKEKDNIVCVDFVLATFVAITSKVLSRKNSRTQKLWKELTDHITFLHDSPGGMYLLIQTAFIYSEQLKNVEKQAEFALFLWTEEEQIHGGKNKSIVQCIRKKGGSNVATSLYMKLKSKVKSKQFQIQVKVENIKDTVCEWVTSKHKSATYITTFLCWLIKGIISILKILRELVIIPCICILIIFDANDLDIDGFLKNMSLYCFILDMVKDVLFWLYLQSRIEFLPPGSFTVSLIWMELVTILLAQVLMGFYIILKARQVFTFKEGSIKSTFTYLTLLILVPFLPCLVVMKLNRLKRLKSKLKAEGNEQRESFWVLLRRTSVTQWVIEIREYRRRRVLSLKKQRSAASICLKCQEIDNQLLGLQTIAASFIMVEGTLEGILQLMILLVFLAGNSDQIVIIGDSKPIFIFNTLMTIFSIISSILGYCNTTKKGQWGPYQKLVVATSATFQILSKFLPMMAISVYTLRNSNSPSSMFAILLPILVHWMYISAVYITIPSLKKLLFSNHIPLQDSLATLLLHVISNTFLALPLRDINTNHQRHKGYELTIIMTINGAEVFCTFLLGYILFWDPKDNLIIALWILSPVSLALGCLLLVFYYRKAHTWRDAEKKPVHFKSVFTISEEAAHMRKEMIKN